MLACLLSLATSGLLLAGGCRDTLDPFDRLTQGPGGRLVTVTDTLLPEADTYIRKTLPNTNWGADTALQVGGGGKNRVLIRFDSTALRTVVGAGTLDSAWLEFTIQAGPSGWGTNERTVDLHRVLKDWAELGATWNCAVDANTGNGVPDCPTQGWDMTNNGNGTFAPAKTDRVTVNNGQTGVIRLNVTADVQGYLGGTLLDQGWVFRKTSEAQGGEAMVFSRESGSQPRLVVRVTGVDTSTPLLPNDWHPSTDSTLTVGIGPYRGVLIYRTFVDVEFTLSADGPAIRAFMGKYGATIAGGLPMGPRGVYVFEIPDPGPSLAAVDSVLAKMSLEPGVNSVSRLYYRSPLVPRGRYPSDGLLSPRAAWFDTSRTTVAWRAMRAPLAWGCENGEYGTSTPLIAILETSLDAQPDLTPSRRVVAPNQDTSGIVYGNSAEAKNLRSHGLAIAGILKAQGDNSAGAAGFLWGAPSTAYAYGTQDSVTKSKTRWMELVVLPDLVASGSHLLVTSSPHGYSADSIDVARQKAVLETWLTSSSQNLLVYPVDDRVITLSSVAAASDSVTLATDRAVAQLATQYPNQVLLVGGSNPGSRTFRSGYWTGAGGTAILAPADSVLVLVNPSDFPGQDARPASGNSYAAPMVAGVAAQLWSMDPTLTAAQVKDYIVRGAALPKSDPFTGQHLTSVALQIQVPGAASPAYQLDAYGALSLLSRERPGTPICGYDVRYVDSAVVLDRPGGTQSIYPMPAPYHFGNGSVSVAQGGRRIAVSSSIYDTYSLNGPGVTVINHQGSVIQTLPNVHRRMYLERDTADIRLVDPQNSVWGNARPLLDLTGPGRGPGDMNQGILNPFVSGDLFYAGWIVVSPTGEYAVAPTADLVLTSCPAGGSGVFSSTHLRVIPLDGSTPVSFHWQPEDTCAPSYVDAYAGNEQAAFSHDGRGVVFGVAFLDSDPNAQGNDVIRTRLYRYDFGVGTTSTDVVPGWYVQGPRFEADDNVLLAYDFDGGFPTAPPGGPCRAVSRQATSLGSTIGTPLSLPLSACYPLDHGTIVRSNLIASRPPGLRRGWSQPIRRTPALPGRTGRH